MPGGVLSAIDDEVGGATLGLTLAPRGERETEFSARCDVELCEDLAQVPFDGSGAEEQLRADLGVGSYVTGQSGDLGFLCCQVVACLDRPSADFLACREAFSTCAFGERLGPHRAEAIVRDAKLLARIEPPTGAA